MKRNKNLIIMGIVLIILITTAGTFLFRYLNREEISDEKYCEKDEDCVKVGGDCCGCNAGGTATAINKKYSNNWINKLYQGCIEHNICPQVISDHWTCFANVSCINNKCELIKK